MSMNLIRNKMTACLFATLSLTSMALAQSQSLSGYTLYGIDEPTGKLVRYSFSENDFRAIGPVMLDGQAIEGIQGMAHKPYHLNLFGFWTDPQDNLAKLIYINSQTGKAVRVGSDQGPGQITGATIGWISHDGQLEYVKGDFSGKININPNNSLDNEFVLSPGNGQPDITRDTLHEDSSAVFSYQEGSAKRIRIKPKGAGVQSTFMINNEPHTLSNANAYIFEGSFTVSVYNDHVQDGKAMGHWWLEFNGEFPGAVANGDGGTVFALQTIENDEESNVDFTITDKVVYPSEPFAFKATVLGSHLMSGNQSVKVTTKITAGNTDLTPFGDLSDPTGGNVNDRHNPRRFISTETYAAGTGISITGRSWNSSPWSPYMTVSDSLYPSNLAVLKDGDPAPDTPAFKDPNIRDFLRDYVDQNTNTMSLDENQIIFLFELASSSGGDQDDLAVLVTLAHHPSELNETDDDDALSGPASRLIKVDALTGGYEQVMTLDRVYTGIAASAENMFYATHDNNLYRLNVFNQTETLIGSFTHPNVTCLETAGSEFYGFSLHAGRLSAVDILTGSQFGNLLDVRATGLETIVFVTGDLFTDGYD